MIYLIIKKSTEFLKFKLNRIPFKLPLALALLLFMASCEDDSIVNDPISKSISENQEILDYLSAMEVNLDSVNIKGDMVYLNYDSGISRADLLDAIHGHIEPFVFEDPDAADFSIEASERQRTTMNDQFRVNAITRNNVANITYFIRPSVQNVLGTWWFNAVNRAADDWTGLSNCRIDLTRTFNQAAADIIVAASSDNILPVSMQTINISGAVAVARIPINGVPGNFISINATNTVLSPRKKNIMIHEFGHTFGFSHTGLVSQGSQEVHGTNAIDTYSMMQPNQISLLSLLSLSRADIRMARVMYPDNYDRPTNFAAARNAPGEVKISYKNPSPVSKPYYWIRAAKYDINGNILETRYFYSRTNNITGNHTMTWGGHNTNTTYLFALRGCNFRRDVWSSRTPQIKVDLN